MKNLKPVTFLSGAYNKHHSHNILQQVLLLKAMAVTDDPKKLQQMIGARNIAEVYRTFDKIAARKEYHRALSKLGITFEYIAKGIKDICDNATKEDVRLRGYQTLLKSLGLDSYKDDEKIDNTGWEEVLMKTMEKNKEEKIVIGALPGEYEVIVPKIPESVRKQKEVEEETVGKSIYE